MNKSSYWSDIPKTSGGAPGHMGLTGIIILSSGIFFKSKIVKSGQTKAASQCKE